MNEEVKDVKPFPFWLETASFVLCLQNIFNGNIYVEFIPITTL